MIEKTIYPELPPHSEYSITGTGKTLLPLIGQGNDFCPAMKKLPDLE